MAGTSEMSISISTPEGKMTPPVPVSTFKSMLDQVRGELRKTSVMKPDADFAAAQSPAITAAGEELRQFIERYEQLAAEKQDIADQQKEVMAEAKGRGFDTKIIRKIIARRKRTPDDIAEEEAVLDLYLTALGMKPS